MGTTSQQYRMQYTSTSLFVSPSQGRFLTLVNHVLLAILLFLCTRDRGVGANAMPVAGPSLFAPGVVNVVGVSTHTEEEIRTMASLWMALDGDRVIENTLLRTKGQLQKLLDRVQSSWGDSEEDDYEDVPPSSMESTANASAAWISEKGGDCNKQSLTQTQSNTCGHIASVHGVPPTKHLGGRGHSWDFRSLRFVVHPGDRLKLFSYHHYYATDSPKDATRLSNDCKNAVLGGLGSQKLRPCPSRAGEAELNLTVPCIVQPFTGNYPYVTDGFYRKLVVALTAVLVFVAFSVTLI